MENYLFLHYNHHVLVLIFRIRVPFGEAPPLKNQLLICVGFLKGPAFLPIPDCISVPFKKLSSN